MDNLSMMLRDVDLSALTEIFTTYAKSRKRRSDSETEALIALGAFLVAAKNLRKNA